MVALEGGFAVDVAIINYGKWIKKVRQQFLLKACLISNEISSRMSRLAAQKGLPLRLWVLFRNPPRIRLNLSLQCFGTYDDSKYTDTGIDQDWRLWLFQVCTEWGYFTVRTFVFLSPIHNSHNHLNFISYYRPRRPTRTLPVSCRN